MSNLIINSCLQIGVIQEIGQFNEYTQIGDNIINFDTKTNNLVIQNGINNESGIIIDISNNILIN